MYTRASREQLVRPNVQLLVKVFERLHITCVVKKLFDVPSRQFVLFSSHTKITILAIENSAVNSYFTHVVQHLIEKLAQLLSILKIIHRLKNRSNGFLVAQARILQKSSCNLKKKN